MYCIANITYRQGRDRMERIFIFSMQIVVFTSLLSLELEMRKTSTRDKREKERRSWPFNAFTYVHPKLAEASDSMLELGIKPNFYSPRC